MPKAKEIVLFFMGIIGLPLLSFMLTYFNFNLKFNLSNFLKISDVLIILVIYTIIIVFVIYTKIRERDEDINEIKVEQKRLGEKLKIHQQLIDLEARVITLEKGGKHGKN
jgi:hypothetical protein